MGVLGFLLYVGRAGDWTGNVHHVVTMEGHTYHVSHAKNPLWRQYALGGADAPDEIEMRQRAVNNKTLRIRSPGRTWHQSRSRLKSSRRRDRGISCAVR